MKLIVALAALVTGLGAFSLQASAMPGLKPAAAAHKTTSSGVEPVRFRDFRCVARGITVIGTRVPRTRGVGFAGRRRPACRRALRQCRNKLRFRKRAGLNPLARCEVMRVRSFRY